MRHEAGRRVVASVTGRGLGVVVVAGVVDHAPPPSNRGVGLPFSREVWFAAVLGNFRGF